MCVSTNIDKQRILYIKGKYRQSCKLNMLWILRKIHFKLQLPFIHSLIFFSFNVHMEAFWRNATLCMYDMLKFIFCTLNALTSFFSCFFSLVTIFKVLVFIASFSSFFFCVCPLVLVPTNIYHKKKLCLRKKVFTLCASYFLRFFFRRNVCLVGVHWKIGKVL